MLTEIYQISLASRYLALMSKSLRGEEKIRDLDRYVNDVSKNLALQTCVYTHLVTCVGVGVGVGGV